MADSTPLTAKDKVSRPPFDSLTLRAVVAELRRVLVGGQVQDVRQPSREEVVLGIRSQGRNLLLLLSADARYARVHLTATRPANAPTPPTFCMTLRKHLENGRVREVRQRDFDRVLEMDFGYTGDDAPPPVTLIAELMGKHSNLILVNAEGTIIDAAKRISHRINRVRETLPGLAYQPPPEQPDRIDPFQSGVVEKIVRELPSLPPGEPRPLADALMQVFAGLSPFLANEIATRACTASGGAAVGLESAWRDLFHAASAGHYSPVVLHSDRDLPLGAYPYPSIQWNADRQSPAADLSAALDESFSGMIRHARYDAAYDDLKGRIERELKWLDRQQGAVLRALQEAERAEAHKQNGELILANLWQIMAGGAVIEVQDYYDPDLSMRRIDLDPKRTPQENAELYFQRYRKALGAREKEETRGVQVEGDLVRLKRARAELERLGTIEAIQSLRDELVRNRLLRPSEEHSDARKRETGPDFQGHKIRRYTTPEGYQIYVGETATANDFLTTRVASPNDLWLHVRAAASSHVIIRTQGQPDHVPRNVIQRAAEICALHSAQKHSSLIPVDFTLKKYVRKPRGSAPGAADYEKETTIEVTPER